MTYLGQSGSKMPAPLAAPAAAPMELVSDILKALKRSGGGDDTWEDQVNVK